MGPVNYPPPVASFYVSSPVLVGGPVVYIDRSYDPAPGHALIRQLWFGRAGSFGSPGVYIVTLWVEDDRGEWGFASRAVAVVARPRPQDDWTIAPGSHQAMRGQAVSVLVQGARLPLSFILPPAFRISVPAEGQVLDYASLNARPWAVTGADQLGVLYVPWTSSQPADGNWQIGVTDGQREQFFTLVVQGTLQVMPSLRQVDAAP